jgi:uncharacterized protein (UPF0332 family)
LRRVSKNIVLDGLLIECYKHVVDWRDYWTKAKENLDMGSLAYQRKKHNVCASRAYYAVFQASIAALMKRTDLRAMDNEWGHGQVQAELNRRLIMRRKVLPGDIGRTPMDLIELRHVADYKPEAVSAKEAKRAYDRAERFLLAIAHALEENE